MGRPRSSASVLPSCSLLLLSIAFPAVNPCVLHGQAIFTVNTTTDSDDGSCDATHCSLREAILAANLEAEGATIVFDIPGQGPHTIRPGSNLPFLLGNVILDGTTDPDFAGTPVIELDGTNAGDFAQGLNLAESGNIVRGIVVNRFSDVGISIGSGAQENIVEGCYVGTDVTGSVALGNGNIGILIGQASHNTVGGRSPAARNLVSGNPEGITVVDGTATGNIILGNYVGTDVTGTAAIPNGTGISLLAPGNTVGGIGAGAGNLIAGNTGPGVGLGAPFATGNVILGNFIGVDVTGDQGLGNDIGVWVDNVGGNVIGGVTEGAGNVISGNREGITFWETGATSNRVEGNFIGTNAAGDAAIPNGMGIPVYSPGNLIGGTEAGAGNLISGNDTNGVNFFGEDATENRVLGNLIGTDATGSFALGNGESGIGILGGANDNIIGGSEAGARNVLSGNQFGVLIGDQSTTGTVIQGNYIGTDRSGSVPIPNTQTGILLWGQNTVIGGAASGAGNVISGNEFAGIDLGGGSSGSIIQGNYIGTDASGTVALGNDLGIWFNFSADNLVGGTAAHAGNVISGNTGANIQITGLEASGNTLQGNFIGTDVTGTVALENGRPIQIFDAPENVIGGVGPGAANVISGNSPGITIEGPDATGNVFQGNLIGTDVTGLVTLGNGGAAIRLTTGASDNVIGGPEPGAGNVITGSGWHGIALFADAGTGNLIRSNSIHGNAGMGIDLGRDAVTANDDGDEDTGANNLQNYPEISSAVAAGSAAVQASLNSTPNASFTLEFFSNDACDDTGFGEGETPLGTASVATDASGLGTVTTTFPTLPGTVLTATATDEDGNTSEFSPCREISTLGVSPSPVSRTVTPGQSAAYTLQVTALGGAFDGTLDLTCTGNPAGTTCTFDEDRVTLSSGQGSATMTVTTVAPARVEPRFPAGPPIPPWTTGFGGLAVGLGGVLLIVFWTSTRRRWTVGEASSSRRWPHRGATVAGATVAASLLVLYACGDGGTKPLSGGTTPGNYTLTATASWESVHVSAAVTLVVREP